MAYSFLHFLTNSPGEGFFSDDPILGLYEKLGIALLIGALVGLEREWARSGGEEEEEQEKTDVRKREGFKKKRSGTRFHFAGIRTFPLISVLGCLSALVARQGLGLPWFFPIAFGVFAALIIVAYAMAAGQGEPGTTTEVTTLLVFLYGALVYWGFMTLAAAMAVVTTVVLSLKYQLHTLAEKMDEEELYSTLKFGVMTIVILPPLYMHLNHWYGTSAVQFINPYYIWLMVIFISGISFAGYVGIRLFGPGRGISLTGLFGGIVSSTAVALSFAGRSTTETNLSARFALGVTIASSVMFLRILIEVMILNPQLGVALAIPLITIALIGGLLGGLLALTQHRQKEEESEEEVVANPFRIVPALKFGLLFAVILAATKLSRYYFGESAIYFVSFISGGANVSAITLSMAEVAGTPAVTYKTATLAVLIAAATNTAVKAGIIGIFGSRGLARYLVPILGGMTLLTAGACGAVYWWW